MKVTPSVQEDGIALLAIEGEVNAYTARDLDRALNDLLAQGHSKIVLDASGVVFVSSAGLRAITFAQREAQRQGGEVRLFGLNDLVRRVFEMAGLDEFLHLSDTFREAMVGW
jgi:anti-sigma B factor antagonist